MSREKNGNVDVRKGYVGASMREEEKGRGGLGIADEGEEEL